MQKYNSSQWHDTNWCTPHTGPADNFAVGLFVQKNPTVLDLTVLELSLFEVSWTLYLVFYSALWWFYLIV